MYLCKICGEDIETNKGRALSKHLRKTHKGVSSKDYVKKYYEHGDVTCPICKTEERVYNSCKFNAFCKKCCRGYTLEKFVIKYGEKDGLDKWNNYKKKQAYSNTYEYKFAKFGMTREQFDEYNKSRSVTLEHMIAKHGDDVGTQNITVMLNVKHMQV